MNRLTGWYFLSFKYEYSLNSVNGCFSFTLVFFHLKSSAVDFTHESLRLLEEEPETVENADRLKDDRAHASLWLYICTLEKNLQEVSDGLASGKYSTQL